MTQTSLTTDQRTVPGSIKKAVTCMQYGAGVTVLQGIVGAVTELSNLVIVLFGLIICAVEVGVWLWVADACRNRSNAARVWGTIFFAVATLGMVQILAGKFDLNAVLIMVDVLSWLAGLGATVMLWQRDSSDFINGYR